MNNKPKKVSIITLGCRVNQYESACIAEIFKNNGFEVVQDDPFADYYVVNTCAVTAESERKSRQAVRKAAKNGKVAVIGCASQISNAFDNIENVIYIGGCKNKTACADAVINYNGSKINRVSDMEGAEYENMNVSDLYPVFSECRAFVKIQDGCNGKCTYCIIPACRGKVRSREPQSIVREVTSLAANGYKEIILTGIEVSAYNKIPLPSLVEAVADIQGVERVRLGSLSPNLITAEFVKRLAAVKKFMPHFHLSLQSCCDDVLRRMKRPYNKQNIIEKVGIIREYIPSCMLSADIIVGFPGETDADFAETARCMDELSVFHIHSFPYSERNGTPASVMPNQLPKNVRHARNNALISLGGEVKKRIMCELNGTVQKILIEKFNNNFAYGHTEGYLEARFPANNNKIGDIAVTRVVGNDGYILECQIITEENHE